MGTLCRGQCQEEQHRAEVLAPAAVCQVSRVFHLFSAGVGCTHRIQRYQLQTGGLAWTTLKLAYSEIQNVPQTPALPGICTYWDNIWQNIWNNAQRKTISGVEVHWNRQEKKGK